MAVEVEDIDLGNALEDVMVFDLDVANEEEDSVGLKSDDEDNELDEEFKIEEDADSQSFFEPKPLSKNSSLLLEALLKPATTSPVTRKS